MPFKIPTEKFSANTQQNVELTEGKSGEKTPGPPAWPHSTNDSVGLGYTL